MRRVSVSKDIASWVARAGLLLVVLCRTPPAQGQNLVDESWNAFRGTYDYTYLTFSPAEQQRAYADYMARDEQRREVAAEMLTGWQRLFAEFPQLLGMWFPWDFAQQSGHLIPRAPVIGIRTATNLYGASFTVPHGRYQGDGLIGIEEVVRDDGFGPVPQARSITRGQRGLRQLGHGWSFEPGGMLREFYVVIQANTQHLPNGAVLTDCQAVTRFSYTSANQALAFQNRGLEQVCSYRVNGEALFCASTAPSQCDASRPTAFWSTSGHVALDVSERDAPVLRWPDGTAETMGAAGPGSAVFNEGLTDPTDGGNPTRALTFTQTRADRNGNLTRLEYPSSTLTRVIDARGREVRYDHDASRRVIAIHAPGTGAGRELVWEMTWSPFTWRPSDTFPDVTCLRRVDMPVSCDDLVGYTTLTRLKVPDGRAYIFGYEPWGALKSVVSPEGATTEFAYGTAGTPAFPPLRFGVRPAFIDRFDQRRLVATTVRPNGPSSPPQTTTIEHERSDTLTSDAAEHCQRVQWVKQTAPNGSILRQGLCGTDALSELTHGRVLALETWDGSRLLEGHYYGNIGQPAGTGPLGHMHIDWERGEANTPYLAHTTGAFLDVRQARIVHFRDGLSWLEKLTYEDSDIPAAENCTGCPTFRTWGNVTLLRLQRPGGADLATTETTYFHRTRYKNRNLIALPDTVTFTDPQRGTLSQKSFVYDEYDLFPLMASGEVNRVDVGTARGNVTTAIVQKLSEPGSVSTHAQFFDTGDVFQAIDARGNRATSTPDFRLCAETPTLTHSALNALGHTVTTVTDCGSGQVLSVVDANGQRACTKYDDLGRVLEVAGPGDSLSAGGISLSSCVGANGATSTTEYFRFGLEVQSLDQQRTVARVKDGSPDGHYLKTFTDGLGRAVQTRTEVDPATSQGFAEVVATTQYDNMGRVARSVIPAFAPASDALVPPCLDPPAACSAPAITTAYDALGRVTSVTPPGLPATTTVYGSDGTNWIVTTTPVADSNRQKRSKIDLLGHTVETAAKWSECGGCFLATTITPDAAGRVRSVADPAGNPTTMTYDGLDRKRTMTDPDMGGFAGRSWTYEYDDNGNLVGQTDAKGQTLRLCYDVLNRITLKDLPPLQSGCDRAAAGCEDVTYFYDGDQAPPSNCVAPDFGIAVSPASVSASRNQSVMATVTVTGMGGFSGATTLGITGLPAGITASFSPATVTPSPGGSPSTLTLSVSGTAPGGTFPLTITATSGALSHSASLSLTVTAPDFAVGLSPNPLSLAQGQSGTTTVTVASLSGFSGTVALSFTGLPAGVSATLSPTSVVVPAGGSANASLALSASASALPGSYAVPVTGTAGGITRTASLSLVVTAPPDFTLSLSPTALGLTQGASGSLTVTVASQNDFSAATSLSVSGLPAGVTATFSPTIVTPPPGGSATSTVTLTASASAATGSFSVTFTGAAGALSHTATLALTVSAPVPCNVTLTPSSASFGHDGGSGSFKVSPSVGGCTWTATSNVPWITVTGGASGTGAGTVFYSVAVNTPKASRTGTVSVKGQNFTVSQAP